MIDKERLKSWEENSKLTNEETRKILEQTYWLSAEKAVVEEIEKEFKKGIEGKLDFVIKRLPDEVAIQRNKYLDKPMRKDRE